MPDSRKEVGTSKRGNLAAKPELAEKFLQNDEKVVWKGGPTVVIVWKFWIGVIFLVTGLIYYWSAITTLEMPAFLPFFIFLDSLLLILPCVALVKIRSTQSMFYYITTKRIIIERGYRFRWLFFPEIGETRMSGRASLVTMLGLKNVYFRSKAADVGRKWIPDEHGVVYALCKDNNGYYQYPSNRVSEDGFYYLTKTEANYVKQLVQNCSKTNSSP